MYTYDSAIADLQGLDDVQGQLGGFLVHEQARAGLVGVVDLPGAVDGAEGGGEVGQHAGHADVVGLAGHGLEGEGVADGLLWTCRVSNYVTMSHVPTEAKTMLAWLPLSPA